MASVLKTSTSAQTEQIGKAPQEPFPAKIRYSSCRILRANYWEQGKKATGEPTTIENPIQLVEEEE